MLKGEGMNSKALLLNLSYSKARSLERVMTNIGPNSKGHKSDLISEDTLTGSAVPTSKCFTRDKHTICCFKVDDGLTSVMAILGCQLDSIWNELKPKHLRTLVRDFS